MSRETHEICHPLSDALASGDVSTRLKAALDIGSRPDPGLLGVILRRCAFEPDFYVRDMLTWALTRMPVAATVPALLRELHSDLPQARSQALHTLSKIKDPATWPAIPRSLLNDADTEVARSAWRVAVILVPHDERAALAQELTTQLGRGDPDVQLSLSRALVALGEDVVGPLLQNAKGSAVPGVQAHALATQRLLRDPTAASELAVGKARRIYALGKE